MNKPLSDFNRGVIIGLKIAQCSNKQIQQYLSENKLQGGNRTIDRIWKQWKDERIESTQFKSNSGRKPMLSTNSIQKLQNFVIQNPASSIKELQNSKNANPQQVSGSTLRNKLKNLGFEQKKDKSQLDISEQNKLKRVQWALNLLKCRKKDIKNCLFSDETWIYFQNTNHSYTWVHSDKQPIQNVKKKSNWPQKCIVWGVIHTNSAVCLKFVEGNINSSKYKELLTNFFNNEAKGIDFSCYQQDNARPHTTKEINQFFEENQIKILPWASQSPDINPIERVWGHLKKLISKKVDSFEEFDKFKGYVKQTFLSDKSIQKLIKNCIESIPTNLNKLIEKKGELIS